MLKTNELRIGNIINYAGKEIIVEGIVRNTIHHSKRHFDQNIEPDYEPFRPIPFTEEWILKSGKSFLFMFQTCWRGRFAYLKINGCRFMWFSDNNTIEVDGGEHILYFVHEFQNLYFSLTGEELVFSSTEP